MQVAFPNAPLQTIRAYYDGFKARAEQVDSQKPTFPKTPVEAAAFIARHFLTEDSSALQFSEPRTVVPSHGNEERIARNFYERFLKTYETPAAVILG